MFFYALVLVGIRWEFPRYTKLSYKLEIDMTYFSFDCFHWKITWRFDKVNKKVETDRVSNSIDALFRLLSTKYAYCKSLFPF